MDGAGEEHPAASAIIALNDVIIAQMSEPFPKSQGELIKRVRAEKTQAAFAKELKVDRTCLSRYENEKLGAPTELLNHCLRAIAAHVSAPVEQERPVEQALAHARQAVEFLERVAQAELKEGKKNPK